MSGQMRLCALLLGATLGLSACEVSPAGPSDDHPAPPSSAGTGGGGTTTTTSTEMPGPGEPCYPELHGPTCVPDENSRTGYVIAN